MKKDEANPDAWRPQLPFFLSPSHCRLIPVSIAKPEQMAYCKELMKKMQEKGIRAEIDDREIMLKKKVVSAGKMWVPYILVVGDREVASRKLVVRSREDGDEGKGKVEGEEEFIERLARMLEGYPQQRLPLPCLLSQQVIFSRLL